MMEPEADPKEYATSDALMTQRCVIVQRDEKGYGLTVSGDNPVRIQSVKDGGAASKAGVQEGDNIIKVNGTLVTNSNHAEVVKLIKAAGSYVALTLLGKQPAASTASVPPIPPYPSQQMEDKTKSITAPTPASDDTNRLCAETRVETLKHMLEKEKISFVQTQEMYAESPSEKLKKDLASIQKRIQLLERQLQSSTHSNLLQSRDAGPDAVNDNIISNPARSSDWLLPVAKHTRQVSNPDTVLYSQINPMDVEEGGRSSRIKRNRSDVQDTHRGKGPRRDNAVKRKSKELQSTGRANSVPLNSEEHEDERGDRRTRAVTIDTMQDFRDVNYDPKSMNLSNPVPSSAHNIFAPAPLADSRQQQQGNQIIAMDDEFQSDQETVCNVEQTNYDIKFDEHGPFDSLEELEKKPAHLAVFLHYLISNSDPSSMFFYLVTDDYKAGTVKEMKKWSYEIFSSFIADNAPMRVESISRETAETIEMDMSSNPTEEKMRQLFVGAQGQAVAEVLDLLADFRRNRSLGLGSIFGDQWLVQENMSKSQEISIVEELLMPHLNRLMDPKLRQQDKNSALASALSTFLKHAGVRVQGNVSLERCPSFANKEKKKGTRPSKKKIQQSRVNKHVKGHQFQETHYTSTAFCGVCSGLLWGIGNQGLRCQDCELNIHKNDVCIQKLDDQCAGRPSRRSGILSMIPANPAKKVKLPNKSKGEDSERGTVTSPGAISPSTVERLEDKDTEIKSLQSSGKVNSLISQFKNVAENESVSSMQTDSGVSTQSGDELLLGQPGRTTNLTRTSSLKAKNETRANRGRGNERRSKSRHPETDIYHSKDDVDMDQHAVMAIQGQGYLGSQSSLSGKSQESISSISDTRTYTDDSDMEAEQDTPNWQRSVDKDIVKKLKPKEVKKQETINELFHTERTHVRNLKVLDKVFYQPMLQEQVLPRETVMYLFPNLPSLLDEHSSFNARMKKDKKTSHVINNVGSLLLERFEGESGETMKKVSADFCVNQRHGLEVIKSKQRKDPKLAAFISEAEGNPLCRRLPLRGIISTQMQRLTKYPLFIENLLKYSQPKTDDHAKLLKALQCCKELLEFVNQAVREEDNRHRLSEITKKMDSSPYERVTKGNPDEVNTSQIFHKLLYDSPLTWKLSRNKFLEMHAMLLEDYVILLQKQDDKFVLKFHSTTSVVAPLQGETNVLNNRRNTHSPIIPLCTTLCRQVATSKKAFFLICTSLHGPQIYELVAPSVNERKTWMSLISSAQENNRRRSSGRGAKPMSLPQRPDYHLNELEEDKSRDAHVHPPAERAESTKVVVKTPEVVTRTVPFNNVAGDEEGDATTLLQKVLEEKLSPDADFRKTSQYIRLLLQRLHRFSTEKNSDPLISDTLDKVSEQFVRVQKLQEEEIRSLEYDLGKEEAAKTAQIKEVQRLTLIVNELQNLDGSAPTNDSVESIVTDLDRNDMDPESKVKKNNRLSYGADSNSSATDESDGTDHHDYEDITEGRDPGDDHSNSGDSSENTLQLPLAQRPDASEGQLYNLQGGARDQLSLPLEEENRASCIQEESALIEDLPTQMESMHLRGKASEILPDTIQQPDESLYWALSESHSGESDQFVPPVDRRTSFDNYEAVDPIMSQETPVTTHQIENLPSGGFSSTSESLSSYADDTSNSSAVDVGRSGQPEGGAVLEEERRRTRNSKNEESGSTTTTSSSSSSGSSRPASMVSVDSGPEDRGDDQSAPDGKDSDDSDDQTIQVESPKNLLKLVDDGETDSPLLDDKNSVSKQLQTSDSMEDDDAGTDVDNPIHLQEKLIIEESLPEPEVSKGEDTRDMDINLNRSSTTEAGDSSSTKQEVLMVVEEEDEGDDDKVKEVVDDKREDDIRVEMEEKRNPQDQVEVEEADVNDDESDLDEVPPICIDEKDTPLNHPQDEENESLDDSDEDEIKEMPPIRLDEKEPPLGLPQDEENETLGDSDEDGIKDMPPICVDEAETTGPPQDEKNERYNGSDKDEIKEVPPICIDEKETPPGLSHDTEKESHTDSEEDEIKEIPPIRVQKTGMAPSLPDATEEYCFHSGSEDDYEQIV